MKTTNLVYRTLMLTSIASMLLCLAHIANSQEDPGVGDGEVVTLDPFIIEEEAKGYSATLSISGTRTQIQIRDLPRSLQVITSELIEDTASYTQGELLEFTSGVTRTDNFDSFKIRGFESASPSRNFFRYRTPVWAVNVDRVEVIKGPAATMYGITSPGGQVNYVTKRPQFVRRGSLDVAAGLHGKDMVRAIVDYQDSFDLKEKGKLGYRFIGGYMESDGPKDRTPDDRKHFSSVFQWEPGPNSRLIVDLELNESKIVKPTGMARTQLQGPQSESEARFGGTFIPEMEWWTPTQDADQLFFDIFYSVPEFSYSNPFDTEVTESTLLTVEYQQKLFKSWNLQLAFLHSNRDREHVESNQENLRGQLQDPKVAFAPTREELDLPHIRASSSFDPFSGIVSQSGRLRSSDLQNTSFQAVITGEVNFGFVRNRLLAGFSLDKDRFNFRQLGTTGAKLNNVLDWQTINWRGIVGSELADIPRQFPVLDENGDPLIEVIVFGGREFERPVFEDEPRFFTLEWEERETIDQEFENTAYWVTMTTTFFEDRLSLMYGIRHDEIKDDIFSTLVDRLTLPLEVRTNESQQTQTKDSLQLAFMFKAFEFLRFYGSYSESLVPQFGIWRDQFVDPREAQPRPPLEGAGLEFGAKVTLWDGVLDATVAYFDAEQTNRVVGAGEDRFGSFQRLMTSESNEGVEMDLIFTPVRNWQTIVGLENTTAITISPRAAEPRFDNTRPSPNIADWQVRIFSKYTVNEGPLKGWSVGLGANQSSSKAWSFLNYQQDRIHDPHAEGYTIYRFMLGYQWEWRDLDFHLRLNLRNATNEKYFISAGTFGNPREGDLSLKMSF